MRLLTAGLQVRVLLAEQALGSSTQSFSHLWVWTLAGKHDVYHETQQGTCQFVGQKTDNEGKNDHQGQVDRPFLESSPTPVALVTPVVVKGEEGMGGLFEDVSRSRPVNS